MIQHKITPAQLKSRILARDPEWFAKVKKITASLPARPSSKHFPSLWTDIKQVWMDLQGSKCMYCETLIEGTIANDVEHFRPKAKVAYWKLPKKYETVGVKVAPMAGPKESLGYCNLAYHPWNYAASCKVCNSILKKNYFPVCGTRRLPAKNPWRMTSERALFIYPIGDIDADPGKLIRFVGMHPEPAASAGTAEYCRALVMIEAFRLNDADERKQLFQARALLLKPLFDVLEVAYAGAEGDLGEARDWIKIFSGRRSPHSSCMRHFVRLYKRDTARAKRLLANAKYFLETGSIVTSDPLA